MLGFYKKPEIPSPAQALPGRAEKMPVPEHHYVTGHPLTPPFPEGMEWVLFGMGCFWGAERQFWQMEGVYTTAAGYAGGHTLNPTYEEVCSGMTGHAEVVLVVYDPQVLAFQSLLKAFWESHDPTLGMRQGNDVGTQYRSVIYSNTEAQQIAAQESKQAYEKALREAGYGAITTRLSKAPAFYYAESYHQQYLAKNPGGYCGLSGTGINFRIAVGY